MTDTHEKMGIGQAVHCMKQGMKVARKGWNGKDMFLYYVPGSQFTRLQAREPLKSMMSEDEVATYHAHIDMKTAQGYCIPWLCSQADLLAEDWEVVEWVGEERPTADDLMAASMDADELIGIVIELYEATETASKMLSKYIEDRRR